MSDLQNYFQASKDFRSDDLRLKHQGLTALCRLAGGADSAVQKKADRDVRARGIVMQRDELPNFIELTIVSPSNLKL